MTFSCGRTVVMGTLFNNELNRETDVLWLTWYSAAPLHTTQHDVMEKQCYTALLWAVIPSDWNHLYIHFKTTLFANIYLQPSRDEVCSAPGFSWLVFSKADVHVLPDKYRITELDLSWSTVPHSAANKCPMFQIFLPCIFSSVLKEMTGVSSIRHLSEPLSLHSSTSLFH